MKHCGTKQLETDRLILRKFTSTDAVAMYRNWASDPEVTKFLTWKTYESVEVAKTVINDWKQSYEKEDFYQWAIVLKELGDEPIGSISVVHINERISEMEIGYCIGKKWWNKGVMTEALQAVIDLLFGEVGVNRISARHDANNPSSGKVMKKCNMAYEGTLKSAGWNNQGVCDMSCYAILRNEY